MAAVFFEKRWPADAAAARVLAVPHKQCGLPRRCVWQQVSPNAKPSILDLRRIPHEHLLRQPLLQTETAAFNMWFQGARAFVGPCTTRVATACLPAFSPLSLRILQHLTRGASFPWPTMPKKIRAGPSICRSAFRRRRRSAVHAACMAHGPAPQARALQEQFGRPFAGTLRARAPTSGEPTLRSRAHWRMLLHERCQTSYDVTTLRLKLVIMATSIVVIHLALPDPMATLNVPKRILPKLAL